MREETLMRQATGAMVGMLACMLASGCGGAGGATGAADFQAPSSLSRTADITTVGGVSSGLQLLVFPNQAGSPVLDAIKSAQSSIDMEMYMLSDQDIVNGLIAAAKRNVTVRVLLEPHPFGAAGANQAAMDAFKGTGVQTAWTSSKFVYTHEKSIIFDGATAWIMTANMSRSARLSNREYLVLDSNADDVAEVQNIFNSDWTKTTYVPGPAAAHLVISPVNARSQLLSLINAAQHTLVVGMETMGDPQLQQALVARARAGVQVRVLIGDPGSNPNSPIPAVAKELKAGGCDVRYLQTPTLHAKVMIADGATVYTGSINATTNSMDNNRELGLLYNQVNVAQRVNVTYEQDWAAGHPA